MLVPKLLLTIIKIRIFGPKTAKFGPKSAFLVNLGQAMQAYSMPCCGSVGDCGARAVSRKTPIYFMIKNQMGSFFICTRLQCVMTSEKYGSNCRSRITKIVEVLSTLQLNSNCRSWITKRFEALSTLQLNLNASGGNGCAMQYN